MKRVRHQSSLIVVSSLLLATIGVAISADSPSNKPAAAIPTVKAFRTFARLPAKSPQSGRRFTTAAFSPDGKRIAALGPDRAVCLWDIKSGKKVLALPVQHSEPFDVRFHPDGLQLATAGNDGIKLWDLKSGKEKRSFRDEKTMRFATRVRFSHDGKRLAGAHSEGVTIWDVKTGKRLRGFQPQASGWSSAAVFTPDRRFLARSGQDGKAYVWNVETGKELLSNARPSARYSMAFSPDGKQLAMVFNSHISVWDWRNKKRLLQIRESMYTAVFSRDGKWLLAPARDHSIVLWDAATGKKMLTFQGHTNRVFSARFSPDGQRVVSTSVDGTVRLWEMPKPFRPVTP